MHVPVLLAETLNLLDPQSGDSVVDATAGFGGHSSELCRHVGATGTLLMIDQDAGALAEAKKKVAGCGARVIAVEENFRHLAAILRGAEIVPKRILFDIGISSYQLEASGRGFSFQKDEPLSMRMATKKEGLTAEQIVNEFPESDIAHILRTLGEERYAGRIARVLVESRALSPVTTTAQLRELIERAVPSSYRHGKIHPATRTFQALRMMVNDETGAIAEGLEAALKTIAVGGRIAVISFHSIEDRIVKHMFQNFLKTQQFRLVTKKPMVPNAAEQKNNPRSRSAKLRVIERIS